jgi:DNA modification methylase
MLGVVMEHQPIDQETKLIRDDCEVLLLAPKDIKIMKGSIRRHVFDGLESLVDSIRKDGQIQPIVVRKSAEGYVLVVGSMRLKACAALGYKVKAVVANLEDMAHFLDVQLAENIHRKGFDLLELADALTLRKKAYEGDNPETSKGGTGRSRPKGSEAPERFTKSIAKQLGVSEATIYRLLQVNVLPEDVKAEISKAETSEKRNEIVREVLREIKKNEKITKMREAAETIAEQRGFQEEDVSFNNSDDTPKEEKPHSDNKTNDLPKELNFSAGEQEDNHQIEEGKEKKKKSSSGAKIYRGKWEEVVARNIPINTVDLILTDPPYERARSGIIHTTRTAINVATYDWDQLDVGWVVAIVDFLSENGQLLAFCPLEFIGEYETAFLTAGLTYKGALIWKKTNPGTLYRSKQYLSSCEALVWGVKSNDYYFDLWKNNGAEEVHNHRVSSIPQGDKRFHPTQKPVELLEEIIVRHTGEGYRVLDPFAGSGSTLVACRRVGRRGIGVEQDEEYYKIARDRIIVGG